MPQRVKLFNSRGHQAVRLPRELQFDQEEEVLIYRQGNRIILEPPLRRAWSPEFLALVGSAPDFPSGAPPAADPEPDS